MELKIESLDELKELLSLLGALPVYRATGMLEHEVAGAQALDDIEIAAQLGEVQQPAAAENGDKPPRKRRTKAEIAAAAALEAHGAEVEQEVEAQAEQYEPSAVAEPSAPLAPLSDVEHLKLCRDFISQHGMGKYEQSFTTAGLTNNIMSFTDEQRAQHRAVLVKLAEG
jgi:hypothetical protein